MMFNKGDIVRFLNEKGEGVISRIINKNLVAVLLEEGFEIPMSVSEIVKIADASAEPDKKQPEVKENKAPKVISGERGVFLALIPNSKSFIDGFHLYMINNSWYRVLFSISVTTNNV